MSGWEGTGITRGTKTVTINKGSTGDRTYTALWEANTNTKYKIEHYKQLPDGTYLATPDETENRTGTTDENVTATQKSYDGYIYDIAKSSPSGKIKGDGSLVLKLYYKAKTDTAYKVEHYLQNVGDNEYTKDESATENKTGKTGEQTKAEAKAYAGFTAQSFTQEEIAGDGSTVVRIYYNRNTSTAYKVEHYLQNVGDNEYTKDESATENKTGKTGEQTKAEAKAYAGFIAQSFTQEEIAGDGSTIIKIYYNRKTEDDENDIMETPKEDENKNNKTEIEDKNKKSGITTDTTIAKKILSKTGIGYTGAIAIVISAIISIFIIIKRRKQK